MPHRLAHNKLRTKFKMGKSRIDPKLKNFIKKITFNMLLPSSALFYLQGKVVDNISGTPEAIAKHLGGTYMHVAAIVYSHT